MFFLNCSRPTSCSGVLRVVRGGERNEREVGAQRYKSVNQSLGSSRMVSRKIFGQSPTSPTSSKRWVELGRRWALLAKMEDRHRAESAIATRTGDRRGRKASSPRRKP